MYYSLFFFQTVIIHVIIFLKRYHCVCDPQVSLLHSLFWNSVHGQSYIPEDVHLKDGLTQEFIGTRKTNNI